MLVAIKLGDPRWTAIKAAALECIKPAQDARNVLDGTVSAVLAAQEAKAKADEDFGGKRIAAMLALGAKVKAETNGQGLRDVTIAGLTDDAFPAIKDKNAEGYGTRMKDRSLLKLVLEGAISAQHAHSVAVELKSRDAYASQRLWDVFASTLRVTRDVHKAGKPFEAVTPDYADAIFAKAKADRAAKAEAKGKATGEGAVAVEADDPLALLRAAEVAAAKRGMDVGAIHAAITAMVALTPLDKPGEVPPPPPPPEPEVTEDLSGGIMAGLVN
jgi:hypothetical protein